MQQSWRQHTQCDPKRWPGRDPAQFTTEWFGTVNDDTGEQETPPTPFAHSVCARCPVAVFWPILTTVLIVRLLWRGVARWASAL